MCHKTSQRGKRMAWLKRKLRLELREKERLYHLWKEGRVPWGSYRDVVKLGRKKSEGPAQNLTWQLRLNTTKNVSINTLSTKRGLILPFEESLKKSLHPLLDAGGSIISGDEEKAEELNAFIASVFNTRTSCPQDTQLPESEICNGQLSEAPITQEEMLRDQLCQLDTHKSMGPDGMHPRLTRKLVKELAKPVSITYQQPSLTRKVPVVSPFKDKGRTANCPAVCFLSFVSL